MICCRRCEVHCVFDVEVKRDAVVRLRRHRRDLVAVKHVAPRLPNQRCRCVIARDRGRKRQRRRGRGRKRQRRGV